MISEQEISELAGRRDPKGWLSLYITVDPTAQNLHGARNTWELELRSQIDGLLGWLERSGQEDTLQSIKHCLDKNEQLILDLADMRQGTKGRALFICLSTQDIIQHSCDSPLRTAAWWHTSPCVRPFVEALDHGRTTGVVIVDTENVCIKEWALGKMRDIQDLTRTKQQHLHEIDDEIDRYEAVSPRSHQDPWGENRIERNEAVWRQHFYEDGMKKISDLAKTDQWQRIVVLGATSARRELLALGTLPAKIRLIEIDGIHNRQSAPILLNNVEESLDKDQQLREKQLLDNVLDHAAAKNGGTVGVRRVLDMLQQGRVATLVYTSDLRLHLNNKQMHNLMLNGSSDSDGYHGVERLIEQALSTSAQVVALNGEPAQELSKQGGAAALLRW